MNCPRCELATLEVTDSRKKVGNRVWRRRRCKNCGHRWTTIEMHAEDYTHLKALPMVRRRLTRAIESIEVAIESVKRATVKPKPKKKLMPVMKARLDYVGPD